MTGYIIFGVGIFGLAIWMVNTAFYRWALRTGRFHPAPPGYGADSPR